MCYLLKRNNYSQRYEHFSDPAAHHGSLSLILHPNMGIKCAEDPFNIGMFFDLRRPS